MPKAVQSYSSGPTPARRSCAMADLNSWDADGKVLPSSMALFDDTISLVVDDREARYPVVVDPISLSTVTSENGGSACKWGYSIANTGRIRGNQIEVGAGIIIGAPYYDNGQTDEGAAFATYYDSSGFPANTIDWTAESN